MVPCGGCGVEGVVWRVWVWVWVCGVEGVVDERVGHGC